MNLKQLIGATLIAIAVAASGMSAASAGPLEDGLAAYERGDYSTALRLWRPLADQGDASAQNNLVVMYANGEGVPQDDAEAARWYRKAADQGIASAQFNLALLYDNGKGVPQDDAEAVRWYRKAADQGNASAQNNLGVMYANGEGVPQDYVLAHKWFNLAAAQGSPNAAQHREHVAKLMTPSQIAEAQRLATEFRPQ